VSVLASAAFLAACNGGGGSQSTGYAPSGAAPAAHHVDVHSGFPANTSFRPLKNVHPDHAKSRVSSDIAKLPRLLFVSDDDTDDVYIFTMPTMQLKGTLTGFAEPQGMCTDRSGNIWITNTETSQVLQYSRAGVAMGSVSVPGYFPVGCAINKTNGDLAVTNIVSTAGGDGNVEVFPGATGTGNILTNPSQTEYFFPTYDKSGNLYVDGFGTSGYILSQCPSGSSSCSTMTVSGVSPGFPGGLNWDRVNNGIILGDQECATGSCQYAATISGSTATVTGTTPVNGISGGICDVDQGTIAPMSKYFAGGCISEATGQSSAAARWAYPAGGTPGNSNTTAEYPIGAAISNK
jgi:hypothetical protein